MRLFILLMISFYQRYISPRKGFKCAYGVLHKDGTCSSKIKAMVTSTQGADCYLQVIAQLDACHQASLKLKADRKKDDKDHWDKWCALDCGLNGCGSFFVKYLNRCGIRGL